MTEQNTSRADWPFVDMEALAKEAECFETPKWAVEAILDKEILTQAVIDPCCGRGVMAAAAQNRNYSVHALDLYDWGFDEYLGGRKPEIGVDFLEWSPPRGFGAEHPFVPFTVFMNPPFSKAEAFIERALELGARKIVCFQRFAWWEGSYDKGKKRGQWWEKHRPNRIYICGDRADCWRMDIPPDERTSSTPTAHAWFVWEKGQPAGPLVGHVYKGAP